MRAPDSLAQTLQPHDLAVIDEEVDVDRVILDAPFKPRGVGCLEHQFVEPDTGDLRDDVGAPTLDVFRRALRLDHDDLGAARETCPARPMTHSASRTPSAAPVLARAPN